MTCVAHKNQENNVPIEQWPAQRTAGPEQAVNFTHQPNAWPQDFIWWGPQLYDGNNVDTTYSVMYRDFEESTDLTDASLNTTNEKGFKYVESGLGMVVDGISQPLKQQT